jgi:peptidyl-prolyl cis-trans isomerase-like protein 2
MGKHKHSKDRLFITQSEMKNEWCGKKDVKHIPIAKLPFFCCSLSLMPFENAVCTEDGILFDVNKKILDCKYNPFH